MAIGESHRKATKLYTTPLPVDCPLGRRHTQCETCQVLRFHRVILNSMRTLPYRDRVRDHLGTFAVSEASQRMVCTFTDRSDTTNLQSPREWDSGSRSADALALRINEQQWRPSKRIPEAVSNLRWAVAQVSGRVIPPQSRLVLRALSPSRAFCQQKDRNLKRCTPRACESRRSSDE